MHATLGAAAAAQDGRTQSAPDRVPALQVETRVQCRVTWTLVVPLMYVQRRRPADTV